MLKLASPAATILCALALIANGAFCQTPTFLADSPYGGVAVTVGSIPVGPTTPGAPPPSGSGICPTGDPCVLTGQYSRYRTSSNPNETSLGGFNSTAAASFGLAAFYALTSTPPGTFLYEPVVAQPLYATNVSTSGGTKNILLVASLNDYVYAYDTSSGAQLWARPLANNCGSGGTAFENTPTHSPGGANLDY